MSNVILGQPVSTSVMKRLPVSSRVMFSGVSYIKRFDGKWTYSGAGGRAYRPADLGTPTLMFVPYEMDSVEPTTTFVQWQTVFVDSVEAGAAAHGVGVGVLDHAYARIGISREGNTPSPDTRYHSLWLLEQAPVGTVVRHDSTHVYRKDSDLSVRQGGWNQLLPNRYTGAQVAFPYTLVRWGTEGDTVPSPVVIDEAEARHLLEVKGRAWKVAIALKRQHSWCETLESLCYRGGVSQDDADAATGAGVALDITGQAALPMGSILFWQSHSEPRNWAFLIRDDSSRNETRTLHLFGHQHTGGVRNSRATARCVWNPGGPVSINVGVDTSILMTEIPVGSLVDHAGITYRKEGDARWSRVGNMLTDEQVTANLLVSPRGNYRPSEFSHELTIRHIGTGS